MNVDKTKKNIGGWLNTIFPNFSGQEVKEIMFSKDKSKIYEEPEPKINMAHNSNIEFSKEKRVLSEQVDSFLRGGLLNILKDVLDQGYILNKQQEQEWERLLRIKINKDDIMLLNSLIKKGFYIPDRLIVDMVTTLYSNNDTNRVNFLLSINESFREKVEEKCQDSNFSAKVWKQAVLKLYRKIEEDNNKIIRSPKAITGITSCNHGIAFNTILNELFPKIKKHFDREVFLSSLTLLSPLVISFRETLQHSLVSINVTKHTFDIFAEYTSYRNGKPTFGNLTGNPCLMERLRLQMEEMVETEFNIEHDEYLKNIKDLLKNDYIETQMKSNSEKRITDSINQLPENSKVLFDEIRSIIEVCLLNKEHLSTIDWLDVKNVWTSKVPKIIERYVTIDKDFRDTMSHSNGKKSNEIMDEALKEIKVILSEKLILINEEKLRKLSVTNREVKEIRSPKV